MRLRSLRPVHPPIRNVKKIVSEILLKIKFSLALEHFCYKNYDNNVSLIQRLKFFWRPDACNGVVGVGFPEGRDLEEFRAQQVVEWTKVSPYLRTKLVNARLC